MPVSATRVPSVLRSLSGGCYLLGEAPGKEEDAQGRPFVGESGKLLNNLLTKAGFNSRDDLSIGNVISFRPDDNNFEEFLCTTPGKYPPVFKNNYIKPEFEPEIARLEQEIVTTKPNVILALGAVALWACTWKQTITPYRGYVMRSRFGCKVVPSFHPAFGMRVWKNIPLIIRDYRLACTEAMVPYLTYPARVLHVQPSIFDVEQFCDRLLSDPTAPIGVDVETSHNMITCLAFAISSNEAMVIPFHSYESEDGSFWPSAAIEVAVWKQVRRVLAGPNPKILQNGLYDLQYFYESGCPVANFTEDTMVMHHSLEPEMPKDLGFLGSLYTNSPPWKHLRRQRDEEKPEE